MCSVHSVQSYSIVNWYILLGLNVGIVNIDMFSEIVAWHISYGT